MRQNLDTYCSISTTGTVVPDRHRGCSGSWSRIALVTLVLLFGGSGTCRAWQVSCGEIYNDDRPAEIVLHPDGHLYAAAVLDDGLAVIKRLAATGAPVWKTILYGNHQFEDNKTFAITVAPDGGIVASGWLDRDFTVVKLEPAQGSVLWIQTLVSHPQVAEPAYDVATDANGDVLAAGTKYREEQEDYQLFVVKLNGGSGAIIWEATVTVRDSTYYYNVARRIVLDAAGNPIIAGRVGYEGLIAKFDGLTGSLLWTVPLDSNGEDIQLDSNEDVVVGTNGAGGAYTVLKVDGSTGSERWRFQFDLFPIAWRTPSLALTSGDDVVLAASFSEAGTYVARIDGDSGTAVWVRTSPDETSDVVVDENDNVYVGGHLTQSGAPIGGLLVRKLSGVNGAPLWQTTVFGSEGEGFARSLAYENGFLYVGGYLRNEDTDVVLLRLDARDGSGKALPVPEFFFEFNPIWDNPLLWVFGFDDQRKLLERLKKAVETDPAMADAVLTRDPRDLLRRPDELVVLVPSDARQEILAVATVIVFGEKIFGGRTAPSVLLFQNGGLGQQWLELAVKLGLWGPR